MSGTIFDSMPTIAPATSLIQIPGLSPGYGTTRMAPGEIGRGTVLPYNPSLNPNRQGVQRPTIIGSGMAKEGGRPNLDTYSGKTLG